MPSLKSRHFILLVQIIIGATDYLALYSLPNLKAGRALLDSQKAVNPFIDLENRQVIEDSKKDLSVGELVEFFTNPSKAYLKYLSV